LQNWNWAKERKAQKLVGQLKTRKRLVWLFEIWIWFSEARFPVLLLSHAGPQFILVV